MFVAKEFVVVFLVLRVHIHARIVAVRVRVWSTAAAAAVVAAAAEAAAVDQRASRIENIIEAGTAVAQATALFGAVAAAAAAAASGHEHAAQRAGKRRRQLLVRVAVAVAAAIQAVAFAVVRIDGHVGDGEAARGHRAVGAEAHQQRVLRGYDLGRFLGGARDKSKLVISVLERDTATIDKWKSVL